MSERTETFFVFLKYLIIITGVAAAAILGLNSIIWALHNVAGFSEIEAEGYGSYGTMLVLLLFVMISIMWETAKSTVRTRKTKVNNEK